MRYYIAYGSNTPQEMKERCPDSKFLGVVTLKGFRLLFRYYATVEESKHSKLKVMLYEISNEDEMSLDNYEGYPTLYDKKKVPVKYRGKTVPALIYFMPQSVLISEFMPLRFPDSGYFARCVAGYKKSGIPLCQLEEAVCYTVKKMQGEV